MEMDRFNNNNNSSNKISRKVRFNLPDIGPQIDEDSRKKSRKEHGTISYVNGTLINTVRIPAQQQRISNIVTVTRIVNPVSVIRTAPTVIVSCMKQQNQRGKSDILSDIDYRIKVPVTKVHDVSRGYSKNLDKSKYAERIEKIKARHIVVLSEPPPVLKSVKMQDCQTICDKFSRFRLFEDILSRRRKLPESEFSYEASNSKVTNQIPESATIENISKNLYSANSHNGIVSDLIHRWKSLRCKDGYKRKNEIKTVGNGYQKLMTVNANTIAKDPLDTLTFGKRFKPDVRRRSVLQSYSQ